LPDDDSDLTMDSPSPQQGDGPGKSTSRFGMDDRRRSRETAGMPSLGDALSDEVDLVGRTLGGFRIISKLGEGAVGAVYLADQLVLRRSVALKVLSGSRNTSEEYVARFVREAHAVAQLVHPNAVQVYDVGEAEGYHYIALEYVDGESVNDLLEKRGAISWRAALEIARQAATSLERAHELGIVHRDIKPDNLMISRRGEVKVADFGLARLADDPAITRHGTILGTPFYMSPEQAEGRTAGPAADLYSLGCTLYHMVAGHPPFEALTAVEVVRMHAVSRPRPPHESNPEIPEAVSNLILAMMAKKPDDRPNGARRLAEMIVETRREVESGRFGGADEVLTRGSSAEVPADGNIVIREVLGPEGRTYRRVPVDMVATARCAQLPEDTREKLVAKVLNLSQGGLFLVCDQPLPAGSLMELSFRPSEDADMLEGLAVVRWVSEHPSGMGLQFVSLSEAERERVSRMVARNQAKAVMSAVTRTELHQRLLRAYYTDMGGRLSMADLAQRTGSSVVVLREGLKIFVQYDLVRQSESWVEFRPPQSEELSKRIKRWVLEHGLS
jgi:serine/threonine protein kinase